jgi:hypothetical protein
MFFYDEAQFSLHGEVNSQNSHWWITENLGLIHKLPFHDKKIHVWYAMSARCEISTISGQGFQTGNILSTCCSTGEFLLDSLKVIITVYLFLTSFTVCHEIR